MHRNEVNAPYGVLDESRLIPCSKGKFAIVDEEDFDWLSKYNWAARLDRPTGRYYAETKYLLLDGKRKTISMHRLILGLDHGDKRQGDHIDNASGLDNRRSNLRICTSAENARNRNCHKNNSSGFKGVRWSENCRRWVASINAGDGRILALGSFIDRDDAARAYGIAATKYHGEFARFDVPRNAIVRSPRVIINDDGWAEVSQ